MLSDYIDRIKHGSERPERKHLRKLGTITEGVVEATPVVFDGRLLRLEWVRPSLWGEGHDHREIGYMHFVDMETEEEVGVPMAHAHAFGSAFEEGGVMYVYAVRGNGGATREIDVFWSTDLLSWESDTAIVLPEGVEVYNTSACRGEESYVLAIELGGDSEIVGKQYTVVFATSPDGKHFTLLSIEDHIFLKERYTACPTIRYADGYFYMIYLERLPLARWVPYIVRTRDFLLFEPGLVNPFMMFDDDDRRVLRPEAFDAESLSRLRSAVNCNNSDVDLCEHEGKTVILYSWGNQHGKEYLARAEYDGPMPEFLQSYFE